MKRLLVMACVLTLSSACKRERAEANTVQTSAVGAERERALHVTVRELSIPGFAFNSAAESLRRERTESGRVEVDYAYEDASSNVGLSSSLNLETSEANARQFFVDTEAAKQAIVDKYGMRTEPCTEDDALRAILAWGERGSCHKVFRGEALGGFYLSVQKGERIYLLSTFTPALAASEALLLREVQARLPKLAQYRAD